MPSNTRRAMTLIELLVAMTLAATLLLLTAQVFRTALDGRERVEEKAAESAAVRRAYETISRDMHSATVPPDESGLQFGLSATPAGSASNVLQFASVVGEPLLVPRASNETVLVQYAVAEDPRDNRLAFWRYETPYPVPEGAAPGTSEETRTVLLLPGITTASYLFYSEEQQNWVESWDGEAGLPTAIRIDLALQDADGRGEPRQESWIFSLPAARAANDEAAEAAETE